MCEGGSTGVHVCVWAMVCRKSACMASGTWGVREGDGDGVTGDVSEIVGVVELDGETEGETEGDGVDRGPSSHTNTLTDS